ncbi:hypothetical protein SAMN02982917_1672 [Azospirillum oryzae]|uniref:Uncharacterized protein n=1 Tax=Azospirillum oryzae TaxID=286727 RepID=A0A1X7EGU5_9PROT|nr:hypothetical protein [Azospirillum oryzae]SMF33749.1 hypothetical protein SAMN02982917_1672 [Azospirillum oryzae]
MTVPAVLRDVAQYGAYAAGRGRHAGLLVAVLLLAGCPANTAGPWGGADVTAARPNAHPASPPVPKPKPVRKASEAATLAPALPMPQPGPPVTAGELTAAQSADQASAHLAAIGSDSAAQAAAPPTGGTPTQSATTNADPDSLVGLDEVQTLKLLGSPVAREEAPPAKIWRYAKGDCTLKVFFFMDMTSSQDFRALSYDMKSSQNVPDADHRCFAQLLAQADAGRPVRAGIQ